MNSAEMMIAMGYGGAALLALNTILWLLLATDAWCLRRAGLNAALALLMLGYGRLGEWLTGV